MHYQVRLKQSEEGYAIWCPNLPGCWSQGDNETQAIENSKEAIQDYLETAETRSKNLTAFDVLDSVEIIEDHTILSDNQQEFVALAGLWENRDISPKSIRQVAWRE